MRRDAVPASALLDRAQRRPYDLEVLARTPERRRERLVELAPQENGKDRSGGKDDETEKKVEASKSASSRPRSREGGALERASLMKRLGKDKDAEFEGGWETGMVSRVRAVPKRRDAFLSPRVARADSLSEISANFESRTF